MPFSKLAHESATAKVAAADVTEVPDAIRAGFLLACQDLELDPMRTARLGKYASIALDVVAPTEGLAKIAADFTEADTAPADPGEQLFRLQLEAQQKGIPVEQFAAQRGVNLAALQKQVQTNAGVKTPAALAMDAKTKADTAKVTVPGAPVGDPNDPFTAPMTGPDLLPPKPPAMPAPPKPVAAAPAPKPAVPVAPVKPPTPAAPPQAPSATAAGTTP